MKPSFLFRSRVLFLPRDNVNTDDIIPAVFLKGIQKTGLGRHLFAHWRTTPAGQPDPHFPFNHPDFQTARILFAGENFGCGSSREHAVWALLDAGVRAVVAPSFADIFQQNALKNGLLPIRITASAHRELTSLLEREPNTEWTIDLKEQRLHLFNGTRIEFPFDSFAKTCLLQGVDELGFILSFESAIARYESDHTLDSPLSRRTETRGGES